MMHKTAMKSSRIYKNYEDRYFIEIREILPLPYDDVFY